MCKLTKLKSKITTALSGIDKTETESDWGWWETSTGAEKGKKILLRINGLLDDFTSENALAIDRDTGVGYILMDDKGRYVSTYFKDTHTTKELSWTVSGSINDAQVFLETPERLVLNIPSLKNKYFQIIPARVIREVKLLPLKL